MQFVGLKISNFKQHFFKNVVIKNNILALRRISSRDGRDKPPPQKKDETKSITSSVIEVQGNENASIFLPHTSFALYVGWGNGSNFYHIRVDRHQALSHDPKIVLVGASVVYLLCGRTVYLKTYDKDKVGNNTSTDSKSSNQVLNTVDFEGLIKHWKTKGFKNIVTMVGAGISTSAGIPDFRSPKTGLYHNLQKYNLPHPTAIFELPYFIHNPRPFFLLTKELYPGTFKPTPCHYFIKLLDEKSLLVRNYTQNIDALERIAGIHADKLVEAHGSFYTNHCLKCRKMYDKDFVKEKIFNDDIPTCKCGGIIKPDIVFFGENLPQKFYDLPDKDFKKCDLLIIMGTSLEVQPFASLINRVDKKCVRLLVNREKVGTSGWFDEGLNFDSKTNSRDVALIGDCDDCVQIIADQLGFGEEFKEMIKREHSKIKNSKKSF